MILTGIIFHESL